MMAGSKSTTHRADAYSFSWPSSALANCCDRAADLPREPVRAWPGAGVSLLTLGVLGAALVLLDGAAGRLRQRSLGPRHALAVGLGALMVLGPALGLAAWSWQGAAEPATRVHRAPPDVLPGVAAAEAAGPAGTRTLVLRSTGDSVGWWLARQAGQRFGDTSAALLQRDDVARTDTAQIAPVVATLLSDTGEDLREPLAGMAVGSVLLLPASEGAERDERTVAALDSAPGLVRVATPRGSVLWRVDPDPDSAGADEVAAIAGGADVAAGTDGTSDTDATSGTGAGEAGRPTRPARARVQEPLAATVNRGVVERSGGRVQALPSEGTDVDTRIAPGQPGRLVVLAERRDAGWVARLDGRRLPATTVDGWAQGFRLPPSGGRLEVRHEPTWQSELDTARVAMLALTLLAAVPVPRRRRRWGMPRRAAAGAAVPGPAPPRHIAEPAPVGDRS